jgi:competence protein ComEC
VTASLRRFRLVPVAAVAWAGAALTTLVPHTATPTAIVAWAAALVLCVVFARRRTSGVLAAVLAAAALAVVASHVALALPARDELVARVGDGGRAVVVSATVVGKIERRVTGELAFDAVATSIRIGQGEHPADGVAVEIRVDPDDVDGRDHLDVGAILIASGSAHRTDPGERAVLSVTAMRGVAVEAPPTGLAAVGGALRRGLVAATADLPAPGAGLIAGLAVGDTSGVDPQLDAAMKTSSLSHLTAVSGANCALVVGLAFGAAALAGASRRLRIVVAVAVLGGFVVLVTPEPSVARAAGMAAVAMLAVALGRPAIGIAVLSLAIAVLLVGDPWLSTSLGFALSAAATAALLLLARPLAVGLERWMPRTLALALAIPLAAQLACGPLLALINPSVPIFGVIANLLAAPAAPDATVVGLAACLALPVPVLQSGLAALAWVPAAWIAATARLFAELPGAQVGWIDGGWGAAALAAVGGAVALLIVARGRSLRRVRAGAAVFVAVVVGVCAGSSALTTLAAPYTLPSGWTILACDIGQGDAVLIRSEGHVALVDTGPDPAILDKCLTRAGIDRLDLLVLTHFDLDHAGGAGAVIGRVDEVLHGPPTSAQNESLLAELAGGGAHVMSATAGQRGELGGASWRIIWPRAQSRAYPGGNDACVVVDIAGGGVPHALFLGDLSASPQRAIVASKTLSAGYDVVKVAHHGSADQDPDLYLSIRAPVALISVGAGNDYGHPRAETLEVLKQAGSTIARTDHDGFVALWETDDAVAVWREHGGDVAPPG